MAIKDHGRQYDLVVFGATGYTGKRVVEHVAATFPTNLKWAVAGRSESKLRGIVEVCKEINSDRIEPAVEVCNLNQEELDALAGKTFILITTVGPFSKHGEFAYKACATRGTHYLDTTGEGPFTVAMTRKYEDAAKASGAFMIGQLGLESAPADICTWSLAKELREGLSSKTGHVTVVMDVSSAPSGGTLATFLSFFEMYTLGQIVAASKPYANSPVPNPTRAPKTNTSPVSSILGVRTLPDLGLVTSSIANRVDGIMVERSWGLYHSVPALKDQSYGPNFSWAEYASVSSTLKGALLHWGITVGPILLAFLPPLRWLIRSLVYEPGTGPGVEESKNDSVVYKGTALPDSGHGGKRAYCEAKFEGSMYIFTAVLTAQAALTILEDDLDLPGGCYTPATLGQGYVNRVAQHGFPIHTKILDS